MKLCTVLEPVEIGGGGKPRSFAIKNSSKMFAILSDKLYTNKERAIVRELSCNCIDAHTAAKTPERPFCVHAPNRFELFYSVRDFGPGLSKEEIEEIYTQYGESTKAESNDYIGAFGLGCKSPFSYAEQFVVTSHKDGVKYTYDMYKDEDNCPAFRLVDESYTDEENGVEVNIPVKAEDCDKFVQEMKFVYRTFKVRPSISGATIVFPEKSTIMEGTSWSLDKDIDQLVFVMGQVAYSSAGIVSAMPYEYRKLVTAPFIIELDIGEADITPSRENLSYDKQTIANLMKKFDLIAAEINDKVSDTVENAASYWDALVKWDSIPSQVRGLVTKTLKFNGKDLVAEMPLGYKIDQVEITKVYRRYGGSTNKTKKYATTVHANKNSRLFFKDINVGAQSKIRYFLDSNVNCNVYLIDIIDKKISEQDILNTFEVTSIPNVSSLPSPPKTPRTPGVARLSKPVEIYNVKAKNWSLEKTDIKAGDFYLPLVRSNMTIGHKAIGWRSSHYVTEFLNGFVKLFGGVVNIERILFVRQHEFEARIKKYGMINVYDYYKPQMVAWLKANNIGGMIADCGNTKSCWNDEHKNMSALRSICKQFTSNNIPIPAKLIEYSNYFTKLDNISDVSDYCNTWSIPIEDKKSNLDDKKFLTDFPVFAIITKDSGNVHFKKPHLQILADYFNK